MSWRDASPSAPLRSRRHRCRQISVALLEALEASETCTAQTDWSIGDDSEHGCECGVHVLAHGTTKV